MTADGEGQQRNVSDLLGYIRQDLQAFRTEVNARLDKLVTQDAFGDERRRVDERFARLGQDLVDEREARHAGLLNEEVERKAALAVLELKGARTGLWVRWSVGLLVGIPAAAGAVIALSNVIPK